MTRIDIISGFLGAGKTTLIKKLLGDALKGQQVVLIENEFGEIGIDGGFLKDAGIEIREMNSGCICCSLVGDFGAALKDVITKYHPDRIIIEPSGVGKLSDVIKAVDGVEKEAGVALNSATTVVDVMKCKMHLRNFGEFFENQVKSAGTIILSRTDKADTEKVEAAVKMLRELNPEAHIITTPVEVLGGKKVLDTMEGAIINLAQVEEEEHHHHHHDHDECCCGHDHDEEHEHHHHDHDHDEDDAEHEEHEVEHEEDEADHEEHGQEETHSVHEIDEHVWTSPLNAVKLVEQIKEELCEIDSENASDYEENAEAYVAQLKELDQEFQDVVDHSKRKLMIFGDRFPFRYFAEAYGLDYYAAFSGCASDTEPSAATMAFLINKVQDENIKTVLKMELSNENIAKAIAEATNADVKEFYSCHNLTAEQFADGETYLSLMEKNVETLREVLN